MQLGIIDQLRSENNSMKEKLKQKEEQLKLLEERMENCFKEEENKIKSLHNTILEEIEVGKFMVTSNEIFSSPIHLFQV